MLVVITILTIITTTTMNILQDCRMIASKILLAII